MGSWPASALSSVVLPAPEEPISASSLQVAKRWLLTRCVGKLFVHEMFILGGESSSRELRYESTRYEQDDIGNGSE